MTHTDNHSEDVLASQAPFEQIVKVRLRQAVRIAFSFSLFNLADYPPWEKIASISSQKPLTRI